MNFGGEPSECLLFYPVFFFCDRECVQRVERTMRRRANSGGRTKNYDEQRRRRHEEAPRREEEGKGEKEGWCAGDAEERKRSRREERAVRKREMKGWPRWRQATGQETGEPVGHFERRKTGSGAAGHNVTGPACRGTAAGEPVASKGRADSGPS